MTGKAQLKMALRSEQRLALFGRLRMAEWIEMPEREFARQIERIENDPLFKKLSLGTGAEAGIIRRWTCLLKLRNLSRLAAPPAP